MHFQTTTQIYLTLGNNSTWLHKTLNDSVLIYTKPYNSKQQHTKPYKSMVLMSSIWLARDSPYEVLSLCTNSWLYMTPLCDLNDSIWLFLWLKIILVDSTWLHMTQHDSLKKKTPGDESADSLPYTSTHWWEWSPSRAAGRRCGSLYRTRHTPASSCPLQGSWHKNRIKTLVDLQTSPFF